MVSAHTSSLQRLPPYPPSRLLDHTLWGFTAHLQTSIRSYEAIWPAGRRYILTFCPLVVVVTPACFLPMDNRTLGGTQYGEEDLERSWSYAIMLWRPGCFKQFKSNFLGDNSSECVSYPLVCVKDELSGSGESPDWVQLRKAIRRTFHVFKFTFSHRPLLLSFLLSCTLNLGIYICQNMHWIHSDQFWNTIVFHS